MNSSQSPSSPKQQPPRDALKNVHLQIPQLLTIPNKTLIDDVLNNLQTCFSNINLRFPNPFSSSSILDNLFSKKNQALSAAEIKKRMAGVPVYTISNYSEKRCSAFSDNENRSVEFFFLSKSDAEDYMQQFADRYDFHTLDVPLNHVVNYEGMGAPIRLVPELSQVKNAEEERRKDIAGSPGDVPFYGVPVFQTDYLGYENSENPGKKYRPLFLRKEDLERTLARYEEEKGIKTDKSNIQVVALENVIQAMLDCSTSKWNDVFFVPPGLTLWTWTRTNEPII